MSKANETRERNQNSNSRERITKVETDFLSAARCLHNEAGGRNGPRLKWLHVTQIGQCRAYEGGETHYDSGIQHPAFRQHGQEP